MEWASKEHEESPSFNQLAVNKETVSNPETFGDFVALYGLRIIQEEDLYYILDGSIEDLMEFAKDWNWKA